jgi:hypothetical protein
MMVPISVSAAIQIMLVFTGFSSSALLLPVSFTNRAHNGARLRWMPRLALEILRPWAASFNLARATIAVI